MEDHSSEVDSAAQAESTPSIEAIMDRLEEITALVSDDHTTLDEALDYYDEAVRLSVRVCNLSEFELEEFQADRATVSDESSSEV